MVAYVITERDGQWAVVHLSEAMTTASVGTSGYVGNTGPAWIDNGLLSVTLTGQTVDHVHQLETLDEAVEHVKKWIARDAARRLGSSR